ncbi:hypothetical protein EON77_18900, partial [bacterium]
ARPPRGRARAGSPRARALHRLRGRDAADELDPRLERALEAALIAPRPEDRVEARVALLEAATTLRLPSAREALESACTEANPTLRARAGLALAALERLERGASPTAVPGERDAPEPACPSTEALPTPAPELADPRRGVVRVVFETDAGRLVLALDPSLAPVAVTRLAALAGAHFFDGVVVHRVVPGFVVQLGCPDGDGYGGSGKLLRCETCGCRVVAESKSKTFVGTGRRVTYVYYHCTNGKGGCSKRGIREEEVERAFSEAFRSIRLPRCVSEWTLGACLRLAEEEATSTASGLAGIADRVSALERDLDRLHRMRMDGEVTAEEYKGLKERASTELERLNGEKDWEADRDTRELRLIRE